MVIHLTGSVFIYQCYSPFKVKEDMCPDNIDHDDHRYDHNINIYDEVRESFIFVQRSVSCSTCKPLA